MEHSYKGRERIGEHRTHAQTHSHTRTHPLQWHMQTTQKITDPYTLTQSDLGLHTQREDTHTLWCSDTNRVLWELMELRHRDLETGSCSQLGEREAVGRTRGKGKRIGEHWHTYENSCWSEEKNMIAVRRWSSVEHILTLAKASFTRQLRWRSTRSKKSTHTEVQWLQRGKKKQMYEKVEGKQRKIATHQRLKLNFSVSPPTNLSPMMNHLVFFVLNRSQVLDVSFMLL